jgi:hypothetical protein
MRKIFTFLAGVFVCALVASNALGQSQEINLPLRPDELPITAASTSPVASSNLPALPSIQVAEKIADAKQLLRSRAALTSTSVTLAALDQETSQINIFSVPKDSFLIKGAKLAATTQLGRSVLVQVISPNGVNTAVTVTDVATGRQFVPLLVQYPIVKSGEVTETAYYTSAHPALLSAEIISAGNSYVTTMLESAARRLADHGVSISRDIIDIAEHLVIVEHTDHRRFLNEDRSKIYPEILSLYALNQGDTFRYSVSSAGAGGMIQMIPRTYEGIRQLHPGIDLATDFVSGMRNHANALEAMLLYINDTWGYLQKQEDVQNAMRDGIASKPELLAAGYNSNPMRLPLYLKNGGAGWRTLIPAETQMYLAIYNSVDTNVQFLSQATQDIAADDAIRRTIPAPAKLNPVTILMSWLSDALETRGRAVFSGIAK